MSPAEPIKIDMEGLRTFQDVVLLLEQLGKAFGLRSGFDVAFTYEKDGPHGHLATFTMTPPPGK